MTVSTVTSLTTLVQQVLTVAEGCLATTTAGTPARSFYSPGPPPWDCCPALVVYANRLSEEVTSPFSPPIATGHRTQFGRINLVTLVVLALRCDAEIPPDGVPNALDVEAVADMVQEDGWALWNGFYDAIRDGTFQDECSDVHFDVGQAVPQSPSQRGGCVGWQFTFRAESRDPELSTFVYDPSGLEFLVTNTSDRLAELLLDIGVDIALTAKQNLSRDRPSSVRLNDPPGPPYARTHDLEESVRPTRPEVLGPTMEVLVIADAVHGGFDYPTWLRINGYEFVDLASFQV